MTFVFIGWFILGAAIAPWTYRCSMEFDRQIGFSTPKEDRSDALALAFITLLWWPVGLISIHINGGFDRKDGKNNGT